MQETTQVRPLGLADLLREIVRFYRSEFLLLVSVSAVVMIPSSLINNMSIGSGRSVAGLLISGLGGLFDLATTAALWGAMIFAVSDRYLDRQSCLIDCYRRAFMGSVYWRVMGVQVLQGLMVFGCLLIGGFIGFILTGIMIPPASKAFPPTLIRLTLILTILLVSPLFVRLTVAAQAVVFERLRVGEALSRSWNLTEGNVLKNGIIFLIMSVLACAYGAYVGTHMGHHLPWSVLAIRHVVALLINTLFIGPISMVAQTLWYFDLRGRKEGLDTDTLKAELWRENAAQ